MESAAGGGGVGGVLGGAMAAAMGGDPRVGLVAFAGGLPANVLHHQPQVRAQLVQQQQQQPKQHVVAHHQARVVGSGVAGGSSGGGGGSSGLSVSLGTGGVPTIQVEKPYGCGDCGKHFKRKDHLNRHRQRSYHNSEPPPPIKSIPNPAFLQGQQVRSPATQPSAQQQRQRAQQAHSLHPQPQHHQANLHQEALCDEWPFRSPFSLGGALGGALSGNLQLGNGQLHVGAGLGQGGGQAFAAHSPTTSGQQLGRLGLGLPADGSLNFKSVAAMDALPMNRFPCPEQGCTKSFKSSYHLRRHHAVHTSGAEGGVPGPMPGQPPPRQQHRNQGPPTQVVVSAPAPPPQPIIVQQQAAPTPAQPSSSRSRDPNKVKVKYECSICGTKLSRAEHLIRHQRRLHPDKVNTDDPKLAHYACQICGKQCFDSHKLKVHMNNAHLEEQPFECPTCQKKFKAAANLRKHKKTHIAEAAAAKAAGGSGSGKASGSGGGGQHAAPKAGTAQASQLQAFQVQPGQMQLQGQAGQYFQVHTGQPTPIIIQVQNPQGHQQAAFRTAQGGQAVVARPANSQAGGAWPTAYAWPVQAATSQASQAQGQAAQPAAAASDASAWPWAAQWPSAQPQTSQAQKQEQR